MDGGHFVVCFRKAFPHTVRYSLVREAGARVMSVDEQVSPRSRLLDLAISYFKKEGYRVNGENIVLEGHSGVGRHFDLIVQKGRLEQGVWVRDWNRTIGVNVIINLDTSSEDVDLSSPIMIGEKFSDHAKSYSNRRKLTLLTKQKIGSFR